MTAKERSRRRIILSTGDQCGWDTPDENIQTMIDAANFTDGMNAEQVPFRIGGYEDSL